MVSGSKYFSVDAGCPGVHPVILSSLGVLTIRSDSDMVPHGAVVRVQRPVPVAERNHSLPLPIQVHYLLGAVV